MKKVSVIIPCYNEESNVEEIANAIIEEFQKLNRYEYEIIFIDNASQDTTREKLEGMCNHNRNIKAIFNIRNFGQANSPYHALLQCTGDCAIAMCCDFQDPVELIPKFLEEWENGYKIVTGIKAKSKENRIIFSFRKLYYYLLSKMSEIPIIKGFSGYALYDREFIEILKKVDDPIPFMRGLVAEFGYKRKDIEYVQPKRKSGKSKNNFFTLYDYAMLSFTSYTKAGLRIATFSGIIIAIISFIIGIIYLVMKLLNWDSFSAGMAPMLIGVFFLGAVQLFFIGFLGEYIIAINERIKHRPLVTEEKRINFDS